jgi:antitoxin component YwqK of YwqJK toxin-antitoxin module
MKKSIFNSVLLFVASIGILIAQPFDNQFVPVFPIEGYVVLKSGETISGKMISRKVNQVSYFITQLTFEGPEGESIYTADDISGFGLKLVFDQNTYNYTSSNCGLNIKNLDKWVFFESKPDIKKGEMEFMMRVNNSDIVLYLNPKSGIGTSMGPDGKYIKGFGSYFLEIGDNKLVKLKSKNYEEYWSIMFGDCEEIKELVKEDPYQMKFKKFRHLLALYNRTCDSNMLKTLKTDEEKQYLKSNLMSENLLFKIGEGEYERIFYDERPEYPRSSEYYARQIADTVYFPDFVFNPDDKYYSLRDDSARFTGYAYGRNDGALIQGTSYVNGKVNGTATEWYRNGQKKVEKNIVDDKLNGTVIVWYECGQKKGEMGYVDGKQNGKGTGWHENGLKSLEVNFVNGKRVSKKNWDEKGNEIKN